MTKLNPGQKSLIDRLKYRWACWWLDSPRIERLRRRVGELAASEDRHGDS